MSAPDRKLPAGLDLNGVTGLEFGIAAALPKDGESGDCKPKIASLTRGDRGVDRIVHQLPCGCGRTYLQGKAFLAEARTDYAFLIGVHQFEWLVENQNHGSATQEVACATANEMTMIKVAGFVFRLKGRSSGILEVASVSMVRVCAGATTHMRRIATIRFRVGIDALGAEIP